MAPDCRSQHKGSEPQPVQFARRRSQHAPTDFSEWIVPILRSDAGAADQLHCQRDRCMQAVFGCGLIHGYADNMPFLY